MQLSLKKWRLQENFILKFLGFPDTNMIIINFERVHTQKYIWTT